MRSAFTRHVAVIVTAMACVAMTAACGSSGEDPTGPRTAPGVREVNLSAPVVKQKVLVPGTLNDYVTIGVISLDVHGKLMVLNLVFTPDFASVTASKPISLDDMLGKTGFGPWLLDTTNLKSYAALDDGGLKSSNDGVKTTNKVPVYVWATFALPEGDVEAIDLYIKTAWPAFTNIPITR